MDLTIIAGPLIGAVIGYFTNYLAVKMLFRPRREIKIGSKTLPFTPGVIQKGKPRLARCLLYTSTSPRDLKTSRMPAYA